jgi:hypothetical protein
MGDCNPKDRLGVEDRTTSDQTETQDREEDREGTIANMEHRKE